MALLTKVFKVGGSIAVGAGIIILAPVVVPIVAGVLKPLAKATIKGGMLAYGKIRETAAETAQSREDLAAEAEADPAERTDHKAAKSKKTATAKA